MGILSWIVVGLIAGWLAGQVMRGGVYWPKTLSVFGLTPSERQIQSVDSF